MFQVVANGSRALVEQAVEALDLLDPSPASAVSAFEIKRGEWRFEAYADAREEADGIVGILDLAAPGLPVVASPLPQENWIQKSLDGLPLVRAGRFGIGGAHIIGKARGGVKLIELEAEQAFGTGHHGTTKGCLLALERLLQRRRPTRVLDVGAGSGVLAIAAAKAGVRQAIAVEIDPVAAEVCAENVHKNEVADRVRVIEGSGAAAARACGATRFDLVFANILFRPLVHLSSQIAGAVAPGGTLILSGILNHQEPLTRQAYEARGLVLADRLHLEGWSTLVFTRPRPAPLVRRKKAA